MMFRLVDQMEQDGIELLAEKFGRKHYIASRGITI